MVCERGVDLVKPLHSAVFSKFIVLAVFLSINLTVCDCERITPERCLVWGPGLSPDVVLPVRYFIIQAVNSNGENLTVSPGKPTTNTACAQSVSMLNIASLKRTLLAKLLARPQLIWEHFLHIT